MKRLTTLPLLAGCTLLLGACSSVPPGQAASTTVSAPTSSDAMQKKEAELSTVTLNENGKTLILRSGQEFIVQLDSNRSTGFSWALLQPENSILRLQDGPHYRPTATSAETVGAGGSETWRLKAIQRGEQTLRLEYNRAWEKGVAPARTVSFTVTVN